MENISINMCVHCYWIEWQKKNQIKKHLRFDEEVLHPRTADQHPAKKKGIKEFFSPDFGTVNAYSMSKILSKIQKFVEIILFPFEFHSFFQISYSRRINQIINILNDIEKTNNLCK